MLTASVVMFRSNHVGNEVVAGSMREAAQRTAEGNNTSIDLLPYSAYPSALEMPTSNCLLKFWVKNLGNSSISDFNQMSVITQFSVLSGDPALIPLNYVATTTLSQNEWKVSLPLALPDATPNDVYQPGVLNRGESMLIEAVVDAVTRSFGTLVVTTPSGVSVNQPISHAILKPSNIPLYSTLITYGQTLPGIATNNNSPSSGAIPDIYVFEVPVSMSSVPEISILVSTPDPESGLDPAIELIPPSMLWWPFPHVTSWPDKRFFAPKSIQFLLDLGYTQDNLWNWGFWGLFNPPPSVGDSPLVNDPAVSEDAGKGDGLYNRSSDAFIERQPLVETGQYIIRVGNGPRKFPAGDWPIGNGNYEITLKLLNATPPILLHCP
jgi:hypothetical protein